MKLDKETVQRRLEMCNNLKRNLKEFEKLSKEITAVDTDTSFYNTDIRLLSVILENYEYGNLIFDKGYIYCITERMEQSDYEKHLSIKHYIAKKVKWDLDLSDEDYEIQEEGITDADGFYDFSIYRIKERKQ